MGRVGFLRWVGDVQGGAGLGAREGARRAVGAGDRVTARCLRCDGAAIPGIAQCVHPRCMSVHACTHSVRIYPASWGSACSPIHLRASLSVSIPHSPAALQKRTRTHLSVSHELLSVFPALQLLCDALSSPALQLHSKEQNNVTFSLFHMFLPSFFFPFLFSFSFPLLERSHFVNAWKQKMFQT